MRPVPERQRQAARHMLSTRIPDEVYASVNETAIVCMTHDQLYEYIVFMSQRPEKSRRRG